MSHYAFGMTTKERLQWVRLKTVVRLLRKKVIDEGRAIELMKARGIDHVEAMIQLWQSVRRFP